MGEKLGGYYPDGKQDVFGTTITYIHIEDLMVDICNVRKGRWDQDEEFIKSIEEGIMNPLIVRPLSQEIREEYERDFGIVAGSRRFHGAKEAGLIKVPCIIKEMDDIDAIALSIRENKDRKDVPTWMYVRHIGKMYKKLKQDNPEKEKTELVKEIMRQTKFSEGYVFKLLEIYLSDFSEILIELMKDPLERSEEAKEYLKGVSQGSKNKILDYQKAYILASELKDKKEISTKRIFEIASYMMDKARDNVRELAKEVNEYPKESVLDIDARLSNKKIRQFTKYSVSLSLEGDVFNAFLKACRIRNMTPEVLIFYYVEEELKRDGYL